MATGQNPAKMSYRRFCLCLRYCKQVKLWLEDKGDLPDLSPAPEPDAAGLGL